MYAFLILLFLEPYFEGKINDTFRIDFFLLILSYKIFDAFSVWNGSFIFIEKGDGSKQKYWRWITIFYHKIKKKTSTVSQDIIVIYWCDIKKGWIFSYFYKKKYFTFVYKIICIYIFFWMNLYIFILNLGLF